MIKETQIPYSRIKFCLVMIGCLSFVALGFVILLDEQAMTSMMYRNEYLNRIMSIGSIFFFGAISITIPFKFFKYKMGIVINEHGIIDHSTFSSIGLIEWKDIKAIRVVKFQRTKALLIDTDKPKKYIENANNSFKKRLLNSNMRIYGTPIYITSLILDVSFSDLEKIMMKAYNEKQTAYNNK